MSTWNANGSRSEPDLAAVDEVRQQFEAAWATGPRPDLLAHLEKLTGATRRHALCDLLWIEWDNLRRGGVSPQLDEYRSRFVELSDVVDEAWRSDFGRLSQEQNAKQTLGGRYTIVKPHARGGIGQVYLATDEELGRQVAVKEIQSRHVHSLNVQERFVREAKITGKLEHPGIVPVYSIGTKVDGSPFYATRFIQGESLQAAIDKLHAEEPLHAESVASGLPAEQSGLQALANVEGKESALRSNVQLADSPRTRSTHWKKRRLRRTSHATFHSRSFRQLLTRFVDVCYVIHYAHTHGVLHRDLKPANIMLGKHGETLVIDWGLAKEVDEPEPCIPRADKVTPLTAISFTTHGALIGTVSYMSPEQAAGKLNELTEASDLYSLGATLYHLLVGHAPLAEEPQDSLLSRIQRGDVPRARAVQPSVPRPLDAICASAMSQDPADRYPSALALAEDLEHWMADEPVTAYAEPYRDKMARWSRRHQTAMTSGVIAALLIAISSVGIAILVSVNNRQLTSARQESENRRIAAETAQSKAETARTEALRERDLSQSLADFMVKCFRSPDPDEDGSSITVAQILDRSFDELKRDTKVSPQNKARFLEALTQSNIGLGLYSDALKVAEYGWEYSQQHINSDVKQLLLAKSILAESLLSEGRRSEATKYFEEVVNESRRLFGSHHETTIWRELKLAEAHFATRRLGDALTLAHTSLTNAQRLLGPDHTITNVAKHTVATIDLEQGRYERALLVLNQLYERDRQHFGIDHPETLTSQNSLAKAYADAGQVDRAISIFEEILSRRNHKLGHNHPYTLNTKNNLANVLLAGGRIKDALDLYKETFEGRNLQLGASHRSTLRSKSALASALIEAGDLGKASPLLLDAWESQKRHLGDHDVDTLLTQHRLGTLHLLRGDIATAVQLLEPVTVAFEKQHGRTDKSVIASKQSLAQAYRLSGNVNKAISLYEDLIGAIKKDLGDETSELLDLYNNLATAFASASQFDRAIAGFQHSLRGSTSALGPDHPRTLQTAINLGICLQRVGKHQEALPILMSAAEKTKTSMGWSHQMTLQSHLGLANTFDSLAQVDKANATYKLVLDELSQHLGPQHVHTINAKRYLAGFLSREKKYSEAVDLLSEAVGEFTKTLGSGNIMTLDATRELATILTLDQKYDDAEQRFKALIAVMRGQEQQNESILAEELLSLGKCQVRLSKYAEAEATLRECLEIRRRMQSDAWMEAVAKSILGEILAAQGKFDEAEPLLLMGRLALMSNESIPVEDRQRIIREATERIVRLYELWNKDGDVKEWTKTLQQGSKALM